MFVMLENFYKDRNDIYNLNITERCRREYHGVILNKFIPFLEKQKISCFEQLSTMALIKFQDYLLSEKIKPQSVNNKMFAVKKVMASMFRKGLFKENPAEHLRGIPVCQGDKSVRGCYELDMIKGVFNKRWKDDTSLILCLLIYATGMRNSEIIRIKLDDIISIGRCHFIQIKKSKTLNGVRMVPLHDFVYRKLKVWVAKNNKTPQSPLFDYYRAEVFNSANLCLASQLGVSSEKLEAENITFYSGRHFWKTMMSCEGLGEDIEEIFMGHKVSGNVAKLYNHRDKQGKKNMVKKAKQVFAILDRCVFKQSRGGLSQRPQGRRGSSPRKTTPKRAKR
jgi:integrase